MEKDFAFMFIILGPSVVLPITIVFLFLKSKMASERNRKEIILAALEKNANIDVEELVRKMNAPAKLLKEKLLSKLTSGLIVSFIGIGLLATAGIVGYIGGSCPNAIYICGIDGAICLAVGAAFIISYFVGKKMLANEMEAEEQNLRQA